MANEVAVRLTHQELPTSLQKEPSDVGKIREFWWRIADLGQRKRGFGVCRVTDVWNAVQRPHPVRVGGTIPSQLHG
jgi:hypothetical protein